MNYYEQPRVSEHLLKLAGYTVGGAALGGGLGTLLGAGVGYGLGSKDKKLMSTLLGAGIGGASGLGIGAGLGNVYGAHKRQQVVNQVLPIFEKAFGAASSVPARRNNGMPPVILQKLPMDMNTPVIPQKLPMDMNTQITYQDL